MPKTFDTESRDQRYQAPPRGKCHVCREEASEVQPKKADAHSYPLIGVFMDAGSAIAHAEAAQAATKDKTIVAFGFDGKELYRGSRSPEVAKTAAK